MGASASINSIIEEEKLKPIDASDVKAESAKEEVIRLRKILHESIKIGTYAWQPAQEPLEFETGGNAITHSIILFHGIGQQATTYLKGDITGDGKNLWFDDYGFEDFLKKGLEGKGFRVVIPWSQVSNAEAVIGPLSKKNGREMKDLPSWVDQLWDDEKVGSSFNWTSDDATGCISYQQSIIRKEIERGIKAENVYVIGHSQGGVTGGRAVLTFPDAKLGGMILLSSQNQSPKMPEIIAEKQKTLPILACHSAEDKIISYKLAVGNYETMKQAVGNSNFTFIEESDNGPPMYHSPLTKTIKSKVLEFLLNRY